MRRDSGQPGQVAGQGRLALCSDGPRRRGSCPALRCGPRTSRRNIATNPLSPLRLMQLSGSQAGETRGHYFQGGHR